VGEVGKLKGKEILSVSQMQMEEEQDICSSSGAAVVAAPLRQEGF